METLKITIISFLLLTCLIVACKDNPVAPDNRTPAIYGKIVDSVGRPISGVGVHYIFYSFSVMRNATISYGLPTDQVVTLKIFDPMARQVATPFDQVQQRAGRWSYYFDGTGFTNGIYTYRLISQSVNIEASFVIITDDWVHLTAVAPLVVTDQNGSFQLDYHTLGIGRRFLIDFISAPPDTIVIPDSISVVLAKPGYQTMVQPLRLDTTRVLDRTFQLSSN